MKVQIPNGVTKTKQELRKKFPSGFFEVSIKKILCGKNEVYVCQHCKEKLATDKALFLAARKHIDCKPKIG